MKVEQLLIILFGLSLSFFALRLLIFRIKEKLQNNGVFMQKVFSGHLINMRTLIVIVVLLFSLGSFAQGKYVGGGVLNCFEDSSELHYRPSISIDTILIGRIQLVSFVQDYILYDGANYYTPLSFYDSLQNEFDMGLVSVDTNAFYESVDLIQKSERKELFKLVCGCFVGDTIETSGGAMCYNPRNAVIFYNHDGSIHSIVEICFECYNHVVLQQDRSAVGLSEKSYDALKIFFGNYGIRWGIEPLGNFVKSKKKRFFKSRR